MPYFGTRFGYTGTGNMQGFVAAFLTWPIVIIERPRHFSNSYTNTRRTRHQFLRDRRRTSCSDYQATEVLR